MRTERWWEDRRMYDPVQAFAARRFTGSRSWLLRRLWFRVWLWSLRREA